MNELSELEKEFVRRVYVNDESVLEKSSAKIRALLQEYPFLLEPLEETSRYYNDPLLYYIFFSLDDFSTAEGLERIRIVHLLIEIDASCLLKHDSRRGVPVHCMLRRSYDGNRVDQPAWMDLLIRMIQVQPSALALQDEDGITPLHTACDFEERIALTVVRLLFKANPDAASVRNKYGEVPMHVACRRPNAKVVQFLIQECPTSLLAQDSGEEIPLHMACASYWHDKGKTVQILIASCPAARLCKNYNKETPLHVACRSPLTEYMFELLVQNHREILSWQDQDGCLPLHHLCDYFSCFGGSVKEFISLLRLHMPLLPNLMKVQNNKGKPPGQGVWSLSYPNFMEQVTGRLVEEYSVRESMKWMNAVSETLRPYEAMQCARIVREWTTKYNEQCIDKLAWIESELNDLAASY
jgi:hypothetical protein